MGAFTSEDTAAYCAHYAVPKKEPGYQSIRTSKKKVSTLKTFKKPNAGMWTIKAFDSITPSPRTGHCTVVVPQLARVYVFYGQAPDETILSDFWYLDLRTNKWTQMDVDQQAVSPRVGARAVLVGNEICVFGGANEVNFVDDFHCINIHNGAVTRPELHGDPPSPRINHVMAFNGTKILVYSGIDVTVLTDLYILDVESRTWSNIKLDHGRILASYAVADSHLYVYGASNTPGFLVFDFSLNDATMLNVSGVVPPSTVTGASLIPIDRYLLLVGGEVHNEMEENIPFAPIYVFNLDTSQWSILPVQPDNVTTNPSDGYLDRNGDFLVPVCKQSSVAYNEPGREVVVFLGSPSTNPPTAYSIKIGNPLATLHLQNDMLSMFGKTSF